MALSPSFSFSLPLQVQSASSIVWSIVYISSGLLTDACHRYKNDIFITDSIQTDFVHAARYLKMFQ